MNNDILQPLIFEDKKQIFIFVEYLMNISEKEQKELADKVKSLNINCILIRCLKRENENIEYNPKFLQFVYKENITSLYLYIKVDTAILKSFVNLKKLGVVFLDDEIFDINDYDDLDVINVTGYDNNFKNIKFKNNINYLSFEKIKQKNFDYSLNINKLKTLVFTGYNSINLNKLSINYLNKLYIESNKEICIDDNIDILENIEILELTKSDTSWLNTSNIHKLINLKELRLEKCDLKFLNSNAFQSLRKLKVLVIDKCKNLESVKNMGDLDRVVILDTRIEDDDTEPLLNINDVHITNYKTYNLKIR